MPVRFQHASEIWRDFPELAAGALRADEITTDVDVDAAVNRFTEIARSRLAGGTESELPEIRAWRRTFSRMGLKPTQYRCAAESLLRRYRKERRLPRLHPLVDICNAISLAFAIPIAVLDTTKITGDLVVRYATGAERYTTFSGETERPDAGEVIFADDAGLAHARRWTNRQSGHSAVRDTTSSVLIVAEAVHDSAASDIHRITETVAGELAGAWLGAPKLAVLGASCPEFEFPAAGP